jgi:hypothetical protein
MAAFNACAQPIQDWAKGVKDTQPQCEKPEGPSHVQGGGSDGQAKIPDHEIPKPKPEPRRLIQVRVFDRNEPWYLSVQDPVMHFQKPLDERLWFAMNEGPQIWIEIPEEPDMGGWIIVHDGPKWRGKESVELGFYEVQFRLHCDSDVPTSKHPMKTRSQEAAAEAKKAAEPTSSPMLNVDSLKITPPAKSPPVVVQPAPKKWNTLKLDPLTPTATKDSMKVIRPTKGPRVVVQPSPKKQSTLDPDPGTPIMFGDSMLGPTNGFEVYSCDCSSIEDSRAPGTLGGG